MPDRSRIDEDFVIVSSFVTLVSKEMNLFIVFLNKFQTEWFVPAFGENIEWDLATNTVS